MVSVPRGGPSTGSEVSTNTLPLTTLILKRSMPRGAGPSWYSPASLYFEPWHGHSNHFDDVAERDAAAQVHAALVERHDAVLGDARRGVVDVAAGRPRCRARCRSARPRCRRAGAVCWICALMSVSAPALISEPKPPLRFGHRKARVAPPNSAPKTASETSRAPRKKSRRETDLTGLGGSSPVSVAFAALLARMNDSPKVMAKMLSATRTMRTATRPVEIANEGAKGDVIVRRTLLETTARPSCSRDRGRTSR